MPDVVTPTPEPLPDYPMPPQVLGLRWHTSVMKATRRGPRRLSKSLHSYEFDDLWSSREGQRSLGRLGFDREYDGGVLHWGGAAVLDSSYVDDIILQVEVEREAARVEAQRVWDRLEDETRCHGWAVPADRLRQAEAMLDARRSVSWTSSARAMADRFEEAVERAGRAVARVRDALSPEDLARCEDPGIRAAVHEACQVMSDADGDRAAINNGAGWSKSTSHRGHWLAELPELDPGLAAVGMLLVHRHRKQLRPDLRESLFPETRRAA